MNFTERYAWCGHAAGDGKRVDTTNVATPSWPEAGSTQARGRACHAGAKLLAARGPPHLEVPQLVGVAAALRHGAFVYAAALHPTADSPLIIATGAFDSGIRLWDASRPNAPLCVVMSPSVSLARINALCFDALGRRLYSGDADGVIREYEARQKTITPLCPVHLFTRLSISPHISS